ncbi:unnamed protein product, partial [Iphiclides podalirius]
MAGGFPAPAVYRGERCSRREAWNYFGAGAASRRWPDVDSDHSVRRSANVDRPKADLTGFNRTAGTVSNEQQYSQHSN